MCHGVTVVSRVRSPDQRRGPGFHQVSLISWSRSLNLLKSIISSVNSRNWLGSGPPGILGQLIIRNYLDNSLIIAPTCIHHLHPPTVFEQYCKRRRWSVYSLQKLWFTNWTWERLSVCLIAPVKTGVCLTTKQILLLYEYFSNIWESLPVSNRFFNWEAEPNIRSSLFQSKCWIKIRASTLVTLWLKKHSVNY